MMGALKSLALITVSIFLSLLLVWILLRGRALNEPVPPPHQHPFLTANKSPQNTPYLIAYGGGSDERPENTIAAFDHAASLSPDLIFWVDVRPTRDGVLVAFRDESLSSTTNGTGWISFTDWTEVEKLDAGYTWVDPETKAPTFRDQGLHIPTLKDLLARYPERRFVINLRDYKPGLDDKIIQVIDEAKAGDRVLIQSEQNGFLKDLREKRAMWLYGTSYAQVTQLQLLLPLGLEAMAPIKGDVYVSEFARRGRDLVSPEAIAEMHRRHKPVFAGPIAPEQAVALFARGVDGLISAKPSALVKLLNEGAFTTRQTPAPQ
jgi:glycerophosphoryl diester phosphodiesterase